jgi:hypothetical protein
MKRALALMTAALTLFAVACGDDSSSESASTTSSATTVAGGSTTTAATSTTAGGSTAGGSEDPASVKELASQVEAIMGAFPTQSGSTNRGATDTTVNLGVVGDFTFGGQPTFPGMCEGTKARVEAANAAKELKRTINVVGCDDFAGDANRTTSTLTDYVDGKKSFALILQNILPLPSNILNEKHVPYFGWGFNASWCGSENPYAFGDTGAANCDAISKKTNGSKVVVNQVIEGLMVEALKKDGKFKDAGEIKLAIIGDDLPTTRLSVSNEKRNAELAGMKVVYAETPVPATAGATADFTPYLSEIKSKGANAVFSLLTPSSGFPFLGALKQSGFSGPVYQTTTVDASILKVPGLKDALDGSYAAVPGYGNTTSGDPGWQKLQAAADKASVPLNTGFIHGYFATDLFVKGAQQLEKSGKDFTTENFANVVNSGWSYPGVPNVFNGTDWPLDHYMGTSCSSVSKFNGSAQTFDQILGLSCGGRSITAG